MRTALTDLLGIELPIIGAPMFLVSGAELVAAVSNAGGLGTLPARNGRDSAQLGALLDDIERRTSRPYGVNLVLRANPRLDADLAVCLGHRVSLLITSLGDPAPIVARARPRGIKVFANVTQLKHARRAEQSGVDGLVAVAAGAGGHGGTISPLVLLPQLADAFALPIVAAGGVADGRGLAAALMLGAAGVAVGTRLIASTESLAGDAYQQMVIASAADDVIFTSEVDGVPANFLRPSLEAFRRGEVGADKRFKHIWTAGQTVALIDGVAPAAAIVRDMVDRAEQIIAAGGQRR
jgi:nitronate monooxygenase